MKIIKRTITIIFFSIATASLTLAIIVSRHYIFEKAILCLKDEKYENAVYYLKPLAFVGYSTAQKYLGECYAFGHGVGKDVEKAKYWLKRATDSNNCNNDQCIAADLYFIGRDYFEGTGVKKNSEEAMNWIKMAADSGYPKAVEYMSQSQSPVSQ